MDRARHRHSSVHRGRGEPEGWERSCEGVGGVTDGMLGVGERGIWPMKERVKGI